MNPDRNEGVRNDLLRIVEQYRDEYPEGAATLEAVVGALVECEDLPPEIILNSGVDSIPTSQRKLDDENVISHPEFVYNRDTGEIKMKNGSISILVNQENEILNLLVSKPGHYFTTEEISNALFGYSDDSSKTSLRTLISRLRNKIPFYNEKGKHKLIRSKPKFGYMYDPFMGENSMVEEVEVNLPILRRETLVYSSPFFKFYPEDREIKTGEKVAFFNNIESSLFRMLVESDDSHVTYEKLVTVFDDSRYLDMVPDYRTVRNHMSKIRIKLRSIGITDNLIKNIHGVGFCLDDIARFPREDAN